MRKLPLLTLAALATTALTATPSVAGNRLRVDCRFYGEHPHFCYSSALYEVRGSEIRDIRFGVGCGFETIFDDGGVADPQQTVTDSLRPRNAATPRIEIVPEGSLRQPGTYTAKLEISAGRLTDGTCYVREVGPDEDDYHMGPDREFPGKHFPFFKEKDRC